MSGEPEDAVSGWTVDTLRAHIHGLLAEMDLRYQQRFDAQQVAIGDARIAAEKAVQAALSAAKEAVNKAEDSNQRRFESVNEFRSTLSDQAQQFVSRAEITALLGGLTDRIDTLDKKYDDRSVANAKAIDRILARGQGVSASLGAIVAGIGALAAVIGIIAFLVTHK